MIKKPFFSCGRPKLKYPVIQSHEKEAMEIPLAEKATVLFKRNFSDIDEYTLKVGDRVIIAFHLDDDARTEIREMMVVRNVMGFITGLAFNAQPNTDAYEKYINQKSEQESDKESE